MKITILLFFFSCASFSQTAIYSKIKSAGNYQEYQTKSGEILKVGDSLSIYLPANGREFIFITQGNTPAGAVIANSKIVVSKIKTVGNNKRGFKTYALFKGYGLPVYIDYESALEVGEIKDPFPLHNQTN